MERQTGIVLSALSVKGSNSRKLAGQTSTCDLCRRIIRVERNKRTGSRGQRINLNQPEIMSSPKADILQDAKAVGVPRPCSAFWVIGWRRLLHESNDLRVINYAHERTVRARLRHTSDQCPRCDSKLVSLGSGQYVCPDGCWSGYLPNVQPVRAAHHRPRKIIPDG